MGTKKCVIFDGDDTLWLTENLYDSCRTKARAIVESCGLDGSQWESLVQKRDQELVVTMGHSPERFPGSCRLAYKEICTHWDPEIEYRINEEVSKVFSLKALQIVEASGVLRHLKEKGFSLALLTKGDLAVQQKRIWDSGLEDAFDLIRIVETTKSPEILLDMVRTLNSEPSKSWMVGNSLKSDVYPALAAGLKTIWIPAHVWEYEKVDSSDLDPSITVCNYLIDLLGVLS